MEKDMLRTVVEEDGRAKAVAIGSEPLLVVWDVFGGCRAYSTTEDNLHWSVPTLQKVDTNYSMLV